MCLGEDFKYHETEFLPVFFLIRRTGETSPLEKIEQRYKRDNYVVYYQFWWTLWYLNEQSSLCHFINMIPFQRKSSSHLLPPFWENNPTFPKLIWKGRVIENVYGLCMYLTLWLVSTYTSARSGMLYSSGINKGLKAQNIIMLIWFIIPWHLLGCCFHSFPFSLLGKWDA